MFNRLAFVRKSPMLFKRPLDLISPSSRKSDHFLRNRRGIGKTREGGTLTFLRKRGAFSAEIAVRVAISPRLHNYVECGV
jgi:hypothetical protein